MHVGPTEDRYWKHVEHEMREYGCTDDFIAAYLSAKDAGAMRVLYWS